MGIATPGQLCAGSEGLGDGVQAKTSYEYETLLQSLFEMIWNKYTNVLVTILCTIILCFRHVCIL